MRPRARRRRDLPSPSPPPARPHSPYPPPHTHTHTHPPQLDAAESWEGAIDGALLEFEREHRRRATYTVCFY